MKEEHHPIRVLLVEDNDVFRQALILLLELQDGIEVVGAVAEGNSAVGAYREHRPDVVVMDFRLPGMDGVELLRFLADEAYRSPVLIISGFDRRVLESAFRLGEAHGLKMVGPLEKPARLEELETLFTELKSTLVS